MSEVGLDTPVPDWVVEHPETLATFQALGVDYCCGGKSLAYACRERGLDAAAVLAKLRRCLDAEHDEDRIGSPVHGPPTSEERTMATPRAKPGDVIDVRPLGPALATARTGTLLKTEKFEVVRLVMAAGKEIAEHKAPGGITVQCLEGRIAFTALGKTQELTAAQLLYLAAGEPHSVRCVEDASFLLTILLHP